MPNYKNQINKSNKLIDMTPKLIRRKSRFYKDKKNTL